MRLVAILLFLSFLFLFFHFVIVAGTGDVTAAASGANTEDLRDPAPGR